MTSGEASRVLDAQLPNYRDLPRRDGIPHSWGVWGASDHLGALNNLTAEHAVAASAEIQRGQVFSVNWNMRLPDPPLFGRPVLVHELIQTGPTALNDVLSNWNTQGSTQWDGLRHVRWVGHGLYNGLESHGVDHWARRGIAGRSVVADVDRWRACDGRPIAHDQPDPITASDLSATLTAQGTALRRGDILLIRTGWMRWYTAADQQARSALAQDLAASGLSADESTAEFLWDSGVAAVAADNPGFELRPQGCDFPAVPGNALPASWQRIYSVTLHNRLIPALGIPVGELWDLDELADDCARDGRYSGFLTSAPLNLEGGTGTPANALVIK
jgi:kynurenine formamidase